MGGVSLRLRTRSVHVSVPPFFLFCVVSLLTFLVQTVLEGQGEQDYAVGRGALHVVVGKSEQECLFTAWLWGGTVRWTRGFLLPERRDWPL